MPTIENCCDCGDECEFALVRAVKTFRGWVKFGWDGVEEITEIYQRMDIHVEMFWRPHAEGTEDPGEICDPGSIPLENRDDTYDIAIEYDRLRIGHQSDLDQRVLCEHKPRGLLRGDLRDRRHCRLQFGVG